MNLNDIPNHIYINGKRRQIVAKWPNGRIHVDSPELPGRPCSQHTLTPEAWLAMKHGSTKVHTSGHWYSLRPEQSSYSPVLTTPNSADCAALRPAGIPTRPTLMQRIAAWFRGPTA